jgi:hypothetical protein
MGERRKAKGDGRGKSGGSEGTRDAEVGASFLRLAIGAGIKIDGSLALKVSPK